MLEWPDDIRDYLSYDPETGVLTWTRSPDDRIPAGSVAGHISHDGYRRISFRGKNYAAHRLAWWLKTGKRPEKQIDHKNRNRDDNAFGNLRPANGYQNMHNRPGKGVLPKGVTVHRTGKFQAQIRAFGRNHYLGLFATAADAHTAYCAASTRLHGEFGCAA